MADMFCCVLWSSFRTAFCYVLWRSCSTDFSYVLRTPATNCRHVVRTPVAMHSTDCRYVHRTPATRWTRRTSCACATAVTCRLLPPTRISYAYLLRLSPTPVSYASSYAYHLRPSTPIHAYLL
eukprot:739202-Rhodomonas_salina.2